MESSYVPVESLIFGRLAYKGMNAEIENLMLEVGRVKIKTLQRKSTVVWYPVLFRNFSSKFWLLVGRFSNFEANRGRPEWLKKMLLDVLDFNWALSIAINAL